MRNNEKKVAIIILNWNGANDTIECLESVLKSSYKNSTIFLVDNNSQDGSLDKIVSWMEGGLQNIDTQFPEIVLPMVTKPLKYTLVESNNGRLNCTIDSEIKIILVKNHENLGFAKANNQVIRYVLKNNLEYDYFYLLNNDTISDRGSISNLVNTMEMQGDIGISSSCVKNYFSPEKIDQAGGKLRFWGKTKYYKKIKTNEIKQVTFVNGCSLLIRKSLIMKYGMLTEKYFFGEEDMELSLRMKKNNVKLVSVATSVVYHKVSRSTKLLFSDDYKKGFAHRLNRLVNMKSYKSPISWNFLLFFSLAYFFIDFQRRFNVPWKKSSMLIRKMYSFSRQFNDVKRDKLEIVFKEIG